MFLSIVVFLSIVMRIRNCIVLLCHVGECIAPLSSEPDKRKLLTQDFNFSNMTELKRLVRMNTGILGGGVPPRSPNPDPILFLYPKNVIFHNYCSTICSAQQE